MSSELALSWANAPYRYNAASIHRASSQMHSQPDCINKTVVAGGNTECRFIAPSTDGGPLLMAE